MDIPNIYDPDEYKKYSQDIEYDLEKFKNPYIVGAMIHRLVEERKYTNAMLKAIMEKLDELINVYQKSQGKAPTKKVLSETEEEILKIVKRRGKVCAEDIRNALKYKGTNAASAKLNNLCKKGFLEKVRAGKKVYFLPVT